VAVAWVEAFAAREIERRISGRADVVAEFDQLSTLGCVMDG
jgi:hypothetical protein